MNHIVDLWKRALRLGLKLEPRGDKLAVTPGDRCPTDFANELRENKRELLNYLEARAYDQAEWLYVAHQILDGDWPGANRSTIESFTFGLRSINHPLARSALKRLRTGAPGKGPR